MSRRILHRAGRHALYWLAVSGGLLLIQLPNPAFIGLRHYGLMYGLSTLPILLLGTYPLLYGVLPQLLVQRQPQRFLGWLAGWLVASALLSNLVWLSYGAILVPRWLGGQAFLTLSWANLVHDLNFNFFALLVVAGAASAGRVIDDWYAQRQRSQQLREQQLHTELLLLKSQLQPTFLFETLGTLQQLTRRKAPESPAAVLHLAALLRYLLYDSAAAATGPLADEIAMLQHYAALETLRLGAGVEVSLTVSGPVAGHEIAPLLLLPLLENAFRHGTGPGVECPWVSLDVVVKPGALSCKVINSRAEGAPVEPEGLGLGRLRQRLAHLYPQQHTLKIVTEPDTVLAHLTLQFPSPHRPESLPRPAATPALLAPLPH